MLIHGESGVGKTWLLNTFGYDKRTAPLLFLETMGGSVGLRRMGRIARSTRIYEVATDKQVLEYCDWVLEHPGQFKTVGLDDFNEVFQNIRIAVAKGMGTTPERITDKENAQFSIATYERARKVWRKMKRLATPVEAGGAGCNVVVTCWSKRGINPLTRKEQLVPHLAGAFAFETPGYFDIVAALGVEYKPSKGADGKSHRVWRNKLTTRDENYFVKDRFDAVRTLWMPTATQLLDSIEHPLPAASVDPDDGAEADASDPPTPPTPAKEPDEANDENEINTDDDA